MVDTNNEVKLDMNLLIMFKCPAHAADGKRKFCIFGSMRDFESKKGLKCKSLACEIRIPKEVSSD